jgi:MoxR-like ATPase
VFANIVIADEINRASPKTQSALLEVMEERRVTVDGVPHPVPQPFLVVATQNPVEMDGTYRLPEAQLDRFLVKLSVGYPSEDVEIEVLRGAALRSPDALEPVTDTATVGEMVRMASTCTSPTRSTRTRSAWPPRPATTRRSGSASAPRGDRADPGGRGVRADQRRGYVLPEDFKTLVGPVFAHRVLLSPDAQLRGVTRGRDPRRRDPLGPVPLPDSQPT